MFSSTSSIKTQGVRVDVRTAWVKEQSRPMLEQYIFAYQVLISNESPHQVQLLRRHWYITDAYGNKREVEGEGVIGRQPILEPGESHQYISGCDFKSPIGRMTGYYLMQRESDGEEFQVRIPEFIMSVPFIHN